MRLLKFSDIARFFEEFELKLIASLRRNLSGHKDWEKSEGFMWTAWQAQKLRNLNNFRRENVKIFGEYTEQIDADTRRLIEEQFHEGEMLADEAAGADSIPDSRFFGVNNDKMQNLMNDIIQLEKDVSSAALRMVDDVYRQTLNKVQLEMATGSVTLPQAIDDAVSDFLAKGINCIVYKDGRRVNVADYVRMALRTTSTRAFLQGMSKRWSELGYDTVLVSQYSMCSETCLPWQGQVYIDDVFTEWNGERAGDRGRSNYCGKWFTLLSVAIRGGLFHPNCRHTLTLYRDGVTKIPEPIDGEKIKKQRQLEQKQRALERKVRRLKRHEAGTQSPEIAAAYRKELREAQHELQVFVNEHNDVLRRDYSREKVYEESARNVKNIIVQGGFHETNAIPQDIKREIVSSIEDLQSQYLINVDEFSFEDISEEYGKVPFQFYPIDDNGMFKGKFIINSGFDWEENLDKMNERIYNRNYKKGILASKNTRDLIAHEMAHFMSFQDCESYEDFLSRERELRRNYIAGVSGYSDRLQDGSETIAEGFVRIRNNEFVEERIMSLVYRYIERWKK